MHHLLRNRPEIGPIILIVFLFPFLVFFPTYAKDYKVIQGTVTKVKDGDTVVIRPNVVGSKKFTCRLYGIDAPETPKQGKRGQAYGREADRELKNLILGYRVDVTLTGDQSYKREICIIKKDGIDINREMVSRGYAWAYKRYLKGPYASEYINAEKDAREKKRGLWVQGNPRPPWEFRRMNH